jgi:hypothetical protein
VWAGHSHGRIKRFLSQIVAASTSLKVWAACRSDATGGAPRWSCHAPPDLSLVDNTNNEWLPCGFNPKSCTLQVTGRGAPVDRTTFKRPKFPLRLV